MACRSGSFHRGNGWGAMNVAARIAALVGRGPLTDGQARRVPELFATSSRRRPGARIRDTRGTPSSTKKE